MLKFLRKYQTSILVVGGIFLMVAFLLPQTLQTLGQSGPSSAYMRVNGEKFTFRDLSIAQREADIIRSVSVINPVESSEHWALLTHLADKGGYVGSVEDGARYRPILAAETGRALAVQQFQQRMGPNFEQFLTIPTFRTQFDDTVDQFTQLIADNMDRQATRSGLNPDQFNMAFAKYRGVMRMFTAHRDAPRLSSGRILEETRRRRANATIDYVFIPASDRAGEIADPDDATLQAHIDAYSEDRIVDGQYGFGYQLPTRVKVEWIKFDAAAIRAEQAIDPIEIQYRLRQEPPETRNNDLLRERAQERIEADLRREAAESAIREAERAILAQLDRARRPLSQDADGFKVLPADWADTMPDLQELADAAVARVREASDGVLSIPAPTIESRTEAFLNAAELQSLPGIGQASAQRGSRPVTFPRMALTVRELLDDPTLAEAQVGLFFEPLSDSLGSRYFARVTEVRPESPPDSIDEVRSDAIQNWKSLQGYETLKTETDALTLLASSDGLEAVVAFINPELAEDARASEVRQATVSELGVSSRDTDIDTEAFREAVMAKARSLPYDVDPETIDAGERTLTVAVDQSMGIAIVRITGFKPLVVEDFRRDQAGIVTQVHREAMTTYNTGFFTMAGLAKRLNVSVTRGDISDLINDPDAEEDADADSSDDEASEDA